MKKIDIMQECICIQRILSVLQGKIPSNKQLSVNGRHSDAFVYVTAGSCTYRFDDQTEFTASAGDVFYLPFCAVYTMNIHASDYKFIFCDFEFAQTEARSSALCASKAFKSMENLFVKLLNRHRASTGCARTECMSILYGIYSALQQDAQKSYIGKSHAQAMLEAKQAINEHFNDPDFSISALSEKIGISEVYLRKLFKAQNAITPSGYLISLRLEHAKKLMRYPFLTLEECAKQSGFSSLQYFCRLFKKETGISPGKYKKEL